jgi:flagellar M-ring protein FliF
MEFFRKAWATIQVQLNKLPATSKWLIGSLLVIFVMVGFLVMQYAGQAEMVAIMPAGGDRAPAVLARLENAGIKANSKAGQIFVSVEKREEAYAVLAESDLLSDNISSIFDDMTKNQTPWMTNAQNQQAVLLAKRKGLSQIIGKMVGVRSADVLIDLPRNEGFGATHVRPSASVNVVMRGGNTVNKHLTQAIAGMVSGAISDMKPEDVVIIDANQGRQYTVKKEAGGLSGDLIEQYQALEQYHREKIAEVLRYIPGVIVAVNVRTDPVVARSVSETKYTPEPLRRTVEEETKTRDSTNAGEAGTKPNTGMSIDGSGANGSASDTTKTETEYADTKVTHQEDTRYIGQGTKQISVTVNVPESYFAGLARQNKDPKEKDAEPTRAEIEKARDEYLPQIEKQVRPLVSTESEGVVAAYMIPDMRMVLAPGEQPAGGGGAAGILTVFDHDWIKPVGLTVLALASLGLMFGMVRKATQQSPMPTIQELAGVPPPLAVEEDLIGEADASEATMAGVELNEDDMRTRRIAEQIADMVKTNPAEAAGLFNRWIRKEG